jgi:hypothetical protein
MRNLLRFAADIRRLPGWRLWLFAFAVVFTILPAYVGSYCLLSGRGMREAGPYQLKGFLYVPIGDVFSTGDLSGHDFLARVYALANAADAALFGGDGLVRSVCWCLGNE